MEDGFFASLHLYISIAKRPSLTILPDVHMYKAVSSNFRVAALMDKMPGMGQIPQSVKNQMTGSVETKKMVAIINSMTPKNAPTLN